ncbi:MAG TPA: hypothetical protein VFG89_07645 [Coriobacteriia bacterium]|nr:hypothetical protein [Coriobacteriia bacterium]
MNCLRAQQTIADALDSKGVTPQDLEAAKKHCRSCAECGRFVTAQLAVKRTLVAEPPADLTDRVMATVRAEAAAAAAAAAAPEVDEAKVAAAVLASDFEAATAASRLGKSRSKNAGRVWLASAAGILLLLGVGTILTATLVSRSIGERTKALNYGVDGNAPAAGTTAAPQAAESGQAGTAADAASVTAGTAVSGPSLITIQDVVYSFTGDATVSRGSLTSVGSTSSSLDAGTAAPISLTVLSAGGDTDVIYIEYQQRMLAFQKVTREYAGKTYVLHSGTIPGFGVWPSLPSGIAQPTAADGSPSLQSTDASAGVTAFVKVGSSAAEGIAFPPGSAGPGGVSGAPVWTWWTPE